jgi:O-antigen/teichoic acid export membrane protein
VLPRLAAASHRQAPYQVAPWSERSFEPNGEIIATQQQPTMNHRSLLVRGVLFSYGALGAQVFYSFASIPLALSHLSTPEFGMFGVTTTIGSYLTMAELGMTESFLRHLFDCKDGKDPARYGRLFTASVLALGLVALLVLGGGILLALFAAPILNIPNDLSHKFILVMLGQAGLGAVTMASRMFGVPLILHHRQDLSQIGQIGLFTIYYVVLHLGFKAGWGIYSMIANQAAGLLWLLPFNALMCRRNGYFPRRGTYGLPSRAEWADVWNYSINNFGIQAGVTILIGLPQLLISSLVGLHAAGMWTVSTRVFGILKQVAFRPFAIGLPMLLDYFVRGDVPLAVRRWGQASQLVIASSGLLFAVAAANNQRFVTLWSGIDTHWGTMMHVNIAFHFLCHIFGGVAYGPIGFSKKFGITWVIPLLQAAAVAVGAYLIASSTGSGGIIVLASLGYWLGMFIFGIRHLAKTTGRSTFDLIVPGISRPFLASPIVLGCALVIAEWCRPVPGYFGLLLSTAVSCIIGLLIMGYLGVSPEVRGELFATILKPLRRFYRASTPAPAESAAAASEPAEKKCPPITPAEPSCRRDA